MSSARPPFCLADRTGGFLNAVGIAALGRRLTLLAPRAALNCDLARLVALGLVVKSLGSLAIATQRVAAPSVAPLPHSIGRLERGTLRTLGRNPGNEVRP